MRPMPVSSRPQTPCCNAYWRFDNDMALLGVSRPSLSVAAPGRSPAQRDRTAWRRVDHRSVKRSRAASARRNGGPVRPDFPRIPPRGVRSERAHAFSPRGGLAIRARARQYRARASGGRNAGGRRCQRGCSQPDRRRNDRQGRLAGRDPIVEPTRWRPVPVRGRGNRCHPPARCLQHDRRGHAACDRSGQRRCGGGRGRCGLHGPGRVV